jgi:hypothetical protein
LSHRGVPAIHPGPYGADPDPAFGTRGATSDGFVEDGFVEDDFGEGCVDVCPDAASLSLRVAVAAKGITRTRMVTIARSPPVRLEPLALWATAIVVGLSAH